MGLFSNDSVKPYDIDEEAPVAGTTCNSKIDTDLYQPASLQASRLPNLLPLKNSNN